MDTDLVFEILNEDRVRNINLINFIKQYPIHSIDIQGKSVMVKGTSDRGWVYISSRDEGEFLKLTGKLKYDDKNFAIIEDWMMPHLISGTNIQWILSCEKLYLPDDICLPGNNLHISELSISDADYIFNNYDYRDYTSVQYIRERIQYGIGLGIYEGHRPAAWIITHDDGAMGFLTVLPQFRRKGYGYELTLGLVKKLRDMGEIPFVHIEKDNIKSMNLALKMGFVKDRTIHWFERE